MTDNELIYGGLLAGCVLVMFLASIVAARWRRQTQVTRAKIDWLKSRLDALREKRPGDLVACRQLDREGGAMTRPDDHIRALAAEMAAVGSEADAIHDRYRATQASARRRTAKVLPTWEDWHQSADGREFDRLAREFATACTRLLKARPTTLAGYALKLQALETIDLDSDDQAELQAERSELIAAGEGRA